MAWCGRNADQRREVARTVDKSPDSRRSGDRASSVWTELGTPSDHVWGTRILAAPLSTVKRGPRLYSPASPSAVNATVRSSPGDECQRPLVAGYARADQIAAAAMAVGGSPRGGRRDLASGPHGGGVAVEDRFVQPRLGQPQPWRFVFVRHRHEWPPRDTGAADAGAAPRRRVDAASATAAARWLTSGAWTHYAAPRVRWPRASSQPSSPVPGRRSTGSPRSDVRARTLRARPRGLPYNRL